MRKKFLFILGFVFLFFGLTSCDNKINDNKKPETKEDNNSEDNNPKDEGEDTPKEGNESTPTEGNIPTGENNQADDKKYDATPTIFLAGDSTVKTYEVNQYIGGWGQYLGYYLPSTIQVKNAAQGGRSSRSFINEGRLYDTKENNFKYTFSENGGKSIESEIKKGDFLFIQFGHNDDDTKSYEDTTYKYQRFVPLGTPDAAGIYPTIEPANKKSTTANLPSDMKDSTKTEIAKYGDNYFAYDETGANGTYKGYLKEYIDFAREKEAIPVLVTPVARVKFSSGQIIGGPGLHGDNFAYVNAVRQLADEEDCLLVDLFDYTKTMLETATVTYANYTMALKPNSLTGTWPTGYDTTYGNTELGYSGIEATHYNKYGAFLTAAAVAEAIIESIDVCNDEKEYFTFKDNVLKEPTNYIAPSNLMPKATVASVEATITKVKVTDPNRTYPSATELEAKLALLPAIDDINEENYNAVKEKAEEASLLYATLNVDDRKEEYKTKIDGVLAKAKEIEISLRPIAKQTYSLDCSTLTAVADVAEPFVVKDTTSGFSISSKCLKLGTNGNATNGYLAIKISGTGKVLISISAYSGNTTKDCLLTVSDGTSEKKENIKEGNLKTYEFEFEIDGEVTFYIYRGAGSGTGVMCSMVKVELF